MTMNENRDREGRNSDARLIRRVALALLTLAIATPGIAQRDYTQDELRALPPACLAQKFINGSLRSPAIPEEQRERWSARLGPGYLHFHHYCWGLIDLSRANRTRVEMKRMASYRSAINNFAYVQRNAGPEFPLLPEVCLRKGMTLRQMGDDGGAATEFVEALRLKPNYTPAYAALIDLYVDLGDYDQARSVLEGGLTAVPSSKILAEKQLDLEALSRQR